MSDQIKIDVIRTDVPTGPKGKVRMSGWSVRVRGFHEQEVVHHLTFEDKARASRLRRRVADRVKIDATLDLRRCWRWVPDAGARDRLFATCPTAPREFVAAD